jgi:hypothetical protein
MCKDGLDGAHFKNGGGCRVGGGPFIENPSGVPHLNIYNVQLSWVHATKN